MKKLLCVLAVLFGLSGFLSAAEAPQSSSRIEPKSASEAPSQPAKKRHKRRHHKKLRARHKRHHHTSFASSTGEHWQK